MDNDRPIPLISLYGNLIVSVQIELSDPIVERLITDVTKKIEDTPVTGLILDFSGADLIDSHMTRRLRDLAVTARLMGVETVVCGMRRAVVITLVEMGLTLSGVMTALNLERALEVLDRKRQEALLASAGAPSASDADEPTPPNVTREASDAHDD